MSISCELCSEKGIISNFQFLGEHLVSVHGMEIPEYLEKYPNSEIASKELWERYEQIPVKRKGSKRYEGTFKVGKTILNKEDGDVFYKFERPKNFTYPQKGEAAQSACRLARAMKYRRNTFIYGPAGCGKSATVRALGHDLNLECSHYPMREGLDPELYLGKEVVVIDEKTQLNITKYVKGKLLEDLEGRVGRDGIRRGVLILIDDIDRAPSEYHEIFRHILEDNAKNIFIPELGINVEVHPETRIVATANSAGRGDASGYYSSVKDMDESILDRFQRVIQYHFLDNEEESEILIRKYPEVHKHLPKAISQIMKCTAVLRNMIRDHEISASFSHRRLDQWLLSLTELIQDFPNEIDYSMVKEASRDWIEWLDEDNREAVVKRVIDIHCA